MTSTARQPPPRRPKGKGKDGSSADAPDRPAGPASSASASSAGATGSASSDFDVGGLTQLAEEDATQGEWLFKHDDLVLGPVSAIILVEKIKKGELSSETPIARDGQPFRPMKLQSLFRDAWLAAEEERRLAAEEKAWQSAMSRTRLVRVVVVLALFALPFAAAAAGARALMIARPWDDTPTWIAKVPPLVDLPQKPPEVKKVEPRLPDATQPPQVADSGNDGDDDVDPKDPKKPRTPKKPGDKKGDDKKGDDKKDDAKSDGVVQETLSNAEAIAPLKSAAGEMKACFKAEMESNPDMPAQVVLSYTVTEDGKAINIALDARELRGRPVVGCVQKAIGALRWPRFNGERKNVSVPFKLGKPPAPKP